MVDALYRLRTFPSNHVGLVEKFFFHECVLDFVKCLFFFYQDDDAASVLYYINMVDDLN